MISSPCVENSSDTFHSSDFRVFDAHTSEQLSGLFTPINELLMRGGGF